MEHEVIIRHPFDVVCGDNITVAHSTEIIKRHRYYEKWCKENATGNWHVGRGFKSDGIHVDFENPQDAANFQAYAAAFWIWLYN
jgi:hypothetical protein